MKIQGWDISPSHWAIVEAIDGKISNFWFMTSVIKKYKEYPEHSYFLKKDKDEPDPHIKGSRRYSRVKKIFREHVATTKPDYVAIEDYAHNAKFKAHAVGEIGGLAKDVIYQANIPLRVYDVTLIKKFAAHNGNASKEMMMECVQKRWDVDFRQYDDTKKKQIIEDLCDATALVMMLDTELRLRSAEIELKSLPPKEIEVFLSVPKTAHTNLLAREFIHRGS